MNIEDITIKQARELSAMFGGSTTTQHPCVGKRVIVTLPGRFIYIGTLEQYGDHCVLKDAQNIRYWTQRDNGLGGLAKNGPMDDDKIDSCPPVWFRSSEEISIMETQYE